MHRQKDVGGGRVIATAKGADGTIIWLLQGLNHGGAYPVTEADQDERAVYERG